MRRLHWLGLFLLSSSWLFLTPIIKPQHWGIGLAFLAGGVVLNIFGMWGEKVKCIDRKYSLLFVPLIISLFFIPYPYSAGSIMLLMGMATAFIAVHFKYSRITPIWIGLILSGLLLTIHACVFHVSTNLVACYPRMDAFAPLTSILIHTFGLNTALHEGTIFVSTAQGALPFTVTWMKLGFYPLILFLVGAIALFFLASHKPKDLMFRVFGFMIVSVVYVIIRYVFLVFVSVETNTSTFNIFWDPLYTTLSFIPFALLITKFYPLDSAELSKCLNQLNILIIKRRHLLEMMVIFLFIISLMGARWFQDPGMPKEGRILIDDFYGTWENSSRKMDKEWYGKLSTYNYYNLAEWLSCYYQLDRNIDHAIDSRLLENYDILILKCLTMPLSDEVIETIIRFVKAGGGLLMIGDHTNVFGMSSYFNSLTQRFGISFNFDTVNDLSTGRLQVYKPPRVLAHPIVQNVQSYQFLTSCSLSASPLAEPVMLGYGVSSDKGDYAHPFFFSTERRLPDFDYGLLLQCVAVKYGRGRVVVYSDSTCFSNYCVFNRGYPEFLFGCMEYLNKTNKYLYLNHIFLALAIVFLLLMISLFRREKKVLTMFLILLIGLPAVCIGIFTFSHPIHILPAPHKKYIMVCLDEEHSDYSKSDAITQRKWGKNFATFFIWTQRIGCTPSYELTLEDALKRGDIVVIINPAKEFTEDECRAIADYLSGGGKLLLMDSVLNIDSTANQLLYNFGMSINHIYIKENIRGKLNNEDKIQTMAIPIISISGGTPVFSSDNLVSLSTYEQNSGKLVVVVDSFMFSDSRMGEAFNVPDQSTRELFELEFYIFEKILSHGFVHQHDS